MAPLPVSAGTLEDDLIEATKTGDTKRVEKLLSKGASINALDQEYGATPLLWAIQKGN